MFQSIENRKRIDEETVEQESAQKSFPQKNYADAQNKSRTNGKAQPPNLQRPEQSQGT